MNHPRKSMNHYVMPLMLALSVSVSSLPPAYAAPGDINSTNDGRDIQGGNYYNTPDGRTTFINSGSGGLWLHKGDLVRGLEVTGDSTAGNLIFTGNGGNLHFSAPGSVVRLDGNVDASALMNGGYMGNGGKVTVDAAFLYQNGQIYANGVNGGMVQFNVGSAMYGPGARIEAMGFGGAGGHIGVNASGAVDIQHGVVFDTSGKVIGTYDSNVINIEGGLVNNEGILRANAVAVASEGTYASANGDAALIAAHQVAPSEIATAGEVRGGTIRLTATGKTSKDCFDCAVDSVSDSLIVEGKELPPIFTAEENAALKQRNSYLVDNFDGDVSNGGVLFFNSNVHVDETCLSCPIPTIQANGSDGDANSPNGTNGGSVIISAASDVWNAGVIEANGGKGANGANPGAGGNGGTVSVNALANINNGAHAYIRANGGAGGNNLADSSVTGTPQNYDEGTKKRTVASAEAGNGGNGGNGGLVAFGYNALVNDGKIQANGGVGGNGASAQAVAVAYADPHQGAQAQASAQGGNGGNGGDGGMVVFSGPGNPVSSGASKGVIEANGGQGGTGGNANAYAAAASIESEVDGADESATAQACATAGAGGQGGATGTIVTPDTATLGDTQTYSAKAGGSGNAGTAIANAVAIGIDNATAIAHATGNASSKSRALGVTINVDGVNPGDPKMTPEGRLPVKNSLADLSIFGKSESEVKALITDAPNVNATVKTSLSENGSNGPKVYDFDPSTGDWADSNSSLTVVADGSATTGTDNLDTTRDNELLLNGENAILLSKAGSDTSTSLLDRASNSWVRTLSNQSGLSASDAIDAGYLEYASGIRNLVINNSTGLDLTLDLGGYADYLNLNTLTVLNKGKLTNNDYYFVGNEGSQLGGHISLLANGDIRNHGLLGTFGAVSGGSVQVSSDGNVYNTYAEDSDYPGAIINFGGSLHGGSTVVKAGDSIHNFGLISSGAFYGEGFSQTQIGGTIQLMAKNEVINHGGIYAIANHHSYGNTLIPTMGGIILSKAGRYNINVGTIQADAYGYHNWEVGNGNGGYIHMHGGSLAVNGSPNNQGYYGEETARVALYEEAPSFSWFGPSGYGNIFANGTANGGKVLLTAGGNDQGGLGVGNVDGFSITQGEMQPTTNPSLRNYVDLSLGESALNFGNIETYGYHGTDGKIFVAGNQQAGAGNGAWFNDGQVGGDINAFFADAQSYGGLVKFVAGPGAVDAVACGGLPPKVPPTRPGDPTDPGDPDNNVDLFGLFQDQRPLPNDRLPNYSGSKLVLAFAQPNMFLAKSYAPVTEEILALALEDYNRELSLGETQQEAIRKTSLYLQQAGVDVETANALVEQIENGGLKADAKMLNILKAMVETQQPTTPGETPTEPAEPGELRQ